MRISIFTQLLLLMFINSCQEKKQINPKINVQYPLTDTIENLENYHGTIIRDVFTWLENDTSEQTKAWVNAQNEVTFSYLNQIPFRDALKKRLEQLWNYPKYSAPVKEGKFYYFYKNDGLQNQSILYRQISLDGDVEVFLDPNTLKEDGTTALGSSSFSKDGKYFAYAVNDAGSDWQTIKIKNTETKEDLKDELKWAKFTGMAWHGNGFYYSRYDIPKGSQYSTTNEYHKIYYHALNTPQSQDKLVFEQKDHPKRYMFATTSEDENLLIINVTQGTHGEIMHIKDLTNPNSKFIQLNNDFEYDYSFIGNEGKTVYVLTNYLAQNYRIAKFNIDKPELQYWENFIAEDQEKVLVSASIVGSAFFVKYMKDAYNKVFRYNMDGSSEGEIELPTIGSVGGFSGKKSDSLTFYTFTSFTYPSVIYKYDILKKISTLHKESEVDFNSEEYETKQVFYTSKDGTKIPMFIVHKKGLVLDGNNPTYLYSYGGFNISLNPSFSITLLPWLEQGGVYAMPNIRGGGEYGERWHKAGMLLNKQNVFDDFIAAAEYLIQEKYTSSEKLAISGRSNGGLLVGACMTQRPDLFKVALPGVGVLDMLKYHKFTVGWGWAVEYGSSDDEMHFKNLLKYSPYHNVRKGVNYPATLVTTADHDDRVVPAHSFKFISELQRKHQGDNPVLIRIDVNAGHGAGKPTSKIIEEWADIWSFTLYNLNQQYTPIP